MKHTDKIQILERVAKRLNYPEKYLEYVDYPTGDYVVYHWQGIRLVISLIKEDLE